MTHRPFQRGDFVTVSSIERDVRAMVCLASDNGRSLMLMFDGIIADHVGMMPVLQDDDGAWHALTGCPVTITRTSTGV